MKCPYSDIGCWYIDDVSHNCEATSRSDCRHEYDNEPEPRRKVDNEEGKD